jgi:hypothetical protein
MTLIWLTDRVEFRAIPSPVMVRVLSRPPLVAAITDAFATMDKSVTGISMDRSQRRVPPEEMRRRFGPCDVRI